MSNFGLIETIKVLNGKLVFKDLHVSRLTDSLNAIGVNVSAISIEAKLLSLLENECLGNGFKDFRLRIEIHKIRVNDCIPCLSDLIWSCKISPLEKNIYSFNEKGLTLAYLPKYKKPIEPFMNLKHTERGIYDRAALYAKENNYNDAIVLNGYNRISDTSICNIFIVKDQSIITPSLSEGPVMGVFRAFIINNALALKVIERSVSMEDLYLADGVFITNAVKGIRWVEYIEDRRYSAASVKNVVSDIKILTDNTQYNYE